MQSPTRPNHLESRTIRANATELKDRKRVLIVYGDLLNYRVPIFSLLGQTYDLTVTHSGRRMTNGGAGFTEIVLPRHRIWRLNYQLGLRKIISAGRFDAVVYFMDIAWPATVINFLRPPQPARQVTWGLWRTGRPLLDAIRVKLAERADCNVFYSEMSARDFISCGLPEEKATIARNTVRIDQPGRNEFTHRNSILVVGSFNSRKQNDITVSAFIELCRRSSFNPSINLTFIGEGSELERIKDLACNSAFANRIEFHRATHDENILRGYYDRAICSVSFGQAGLSVLQSFAYGVPFITRSDAISGGEIENIFNGVNGLLIDNSQTALEDAIESLVADPVLARDMGHSALEYYMNFARAENMIDGFIRAIEIESGKLKVGR